MAHLHIWLITWMGGNGTTRLTSLAPSKGRPEMTPQSQAWQYRSATGYILCSVLLLLCLQTPPSTPFTLLFLFGQSGGHLENLLTTKNTWEWYKITWMSQCYLQHFFCEEQSEYVGHFFVNWQTEEHKLVKYYSLSEKWVNGCCGWDIQYYWSSIGQTFTELSLSAHLHIKLHETTWLSSVTVMCLTLWLQEINSNVINKIYYLMKILNILLL